MISRLPTIANAVRRIRAGELTSTDLVEFCLQRIDRYEPSIAAWELVDRQGARREAARCDEHANDGFRGALHGIPIGIKDIIDVEGWPTKAGSSTRADHIARDDATLVRLLRQAGAIILGKTVTTEFAGFDPARTRNPWNVSRTPGGSSSGSAAAVAAQMCMAAVGTQTGGSIIRPASYCGVCGLKPTLDQVSMDGVVPVSDHLDHAGPITRTVDDAARVFFSCVTPKILEVMWKCRNGERGLIPIDVEPDEVTASSLDWLLSEHPEAISGQVNLRPLAGYFEEAATAGAGKCFQDALSRLRVAKQVASPLPLPASFENLHDRHRRVMAVDAAAYHREVFEQRPDDFGPHMTSLIKTGMGELAADYVAAVQGRTQFRDDMCDLLGDNTLAITPSTTTTAPTLETTGDPAFNSPWSYAGLPAMTIPCGVDDEGMPCGLQIIGPTNSELRVLRAAWLCEKALAFQQTPILPEA